MCLYVLIVSYIVLEYYMGVRVYAVRTVTIRVSEKVAEVVEEMVKLGIARSRNHAYNIIIEAGLAKALKLIEHKRKVIELTEKFLKQGLPYRKLPTVSDVEKVRER